MGESGHLHSLRCGTKAFVNMSARVTKVVTPRGTSRNPPRKKIVLGVDLNVPISQVPTDEGTSSQPPVPQETQAVHQAGPSQITFIDVDSIDDDVVVSSASAFAAARNNSRSRGRAIVDVDSEESSRCGANNHNKRQKVPANLPIINCETYVSLKSDNNVICGVETLMLLPQSPLPPPPPPKEPTFSCPVCMGPLVEEMSTKCGHIFCNGCIKAAIHAQKKCPTCRRKATMKDIIRVYLPATN